MRALHRDAVDAPVPVVASALAVLGLVLTSYGAHTHLSVAAQQAGHCDLCEPWHPLFVLAPIGLGASLLLASVLLFGRASE